MYIEEDNKTVNENWLQNARENIEQAVIEGDFHLARDIIADARDNGYENAALVWESAIIQEQNKEKTL